MIKNQKIAIIGFGKEGTSAANYLSTYNEIDIFDSKSKEEFTKLDFKKLQNNKKINFYFENKYPKGKIFNYIIRSPGIRPDNPTILAIKTNKSILLSPTSLFFDLCPCPIIGVTGTKGKGTTSTLIYEMIKSQNRDVYLAGNIGLPALEILPKLSKTSSVVLELSSFQLMDLKKSPHISVVLMIVPEHLNWHKSYSEYETAKQSIVKYQKKSDFAFINADFKSSSNFAKITKAKTFYFSTAGSTNGTYIKSGAVFSKINKNEKVCQIKNIFIPGKHNLQNVLAATAVAKLLKISNENIQKVLLTFKGLPHRLQLVRNNNGVNYYNDSFSTTPETTIAAIESFDNPKILILGGSGKNSDFVKLGTKIIQDNSIKAIILIGEERDKIKKACEGFNGIFDLNKKNMHEIITFCSQIAKQGDVVLLSPACASFDMFKNYTDRGNQFISEVNNLK